MTKNHTSFPLLTSLTHYFYFYKMHRAMDRLYDKSSYFKSSQQLPSLSRAINQLDMECQKYECFLNKFNYSHHLSKYLSYYRQWSFLAKSMAFMQESNPEHAQLFVQKAINSEICFPSLVAKVFDYIISWRAYLKNHQVNAQDTYFIEHEKQGEQLIAQLHQMDMYGPIKTALICILHFEQAYMAFYWHAPSYCDICLDRLHKISNEDNARVGSFINKELIEEKYDFLSKIYPVEFLELALSKVPPQFLMEYDLMDMEDKQKLI